MSKTKIYQWIKGLAVAGIILAIYLLWQQAAPSPFQPCSISANINCDAIISGEVSKTLGLPTPLYGLVGYIIILLAAIYKKPKLTLAMATFGLLFCLYIAYRELFELNVICPICILCQVIMISVFVLGILLLGRPAARPKK